MEFLKDRRLAFIVFGTIAVVLLVTYAAGWFDKEAPQVETPAKQESTTE